MLGRSCSSKELQVDRVLAQPLENTHGMRSFVRLTGETGHEMVERMNLIVEWAKAHETGETHKIYVVWRNVVQRKIGHDLIYRHLLYVKSR